MASDQLRKKFMCMDDRPRSSVLAAANDFSGYYTRPISFLLALSQV